MTAVDLKVKTDSKSELWTEIL